LLNFNKFGYKIIILRKNHQVVCLFFVTLCMFVFVTLCMFVFVTLCMFIFVTLCMFIFVTLCMFVFVTLCMFEIRKVWSWKSSKLEKIEVGRVNITIKYMLIFRNTFQWCKFYVCFIWKDIDTYILVIKSHVFPFKNNYNNDIANFVAYCLIYKISNFPT